MHVCLPKYQNIHVIPVGADGSAFINSKSLNSPSPRIFYCGNFGKLHDVDTARMHLEVQGEGVVTAADIMAPPEVEIINPDLYLFTMDSGAGLMDMELSVERGRGYSPADEAVNIDDSQLLLDRFVRQVVVHLRLTNGDISVQNVIKMKPSLGHASRACQKEHLSDGNEPLFVAQGSQRIQNRRFRIRAFEPGVDTND